MAEARAPLDWNRDGRDWPGRETSRFVEAAGLRWHVQQSGKGPSALLIHGTGASTHSWHWLAPHLSPRFSLTMIDLPGHAFTTSPPSSRMTLPAFSSAIGELLRALNLSPRLVIGHSAGAAILIRMTLDRLIRPDHIVSINGALKPFPGMAGHIFPAMAKMLFLNPLTPRFFAWRATRAGVVEKLIEGTGSRVPAMSLELYKRLFASADHVNGALSMMANWDLARLHRELPTLACPLIQLVGSNDRAVPPDQAFQIAKRIPGAQSVLLRGLGHLAHEEDGERAAAAIVENVTKKELVEGIA
jgi:magnesium chelatase accessory protein